MVFPRLPAFFSKNPHGREIEEKKSEDESRHNRSGRKYGKRKPANKPIGPRPTENRHERVENQAVSDVDAVFVASRVEKKIKPKKKNEGGEQCQNCQVIFPLGGRADQEKSKGRGREEFGVHEKRKI